MRKKGFPINRIPPHILEMCRLRFRTRLDDNRSGPIDYLNLFSISDDDISILLEIAGWLGRDDDMHGCLDAPLHAWEALSLLDPEKVIPGALEVLNHLDWDNLDGFHDEIYIPLAETVAKAPDTIPLFLNALQESQRHEETRAVILDTVRHATWKMSHDKRRFQEVLINQLAERRIDSRNWYASIVCELAFAEDMTPELIELLREVCLGGLVNLSVVACNDGLKEQVGLDFEDDPELRPMYEKFRTVSDILWDFKRCERTFPKDAVNRAREHREQIIPNLIEAVRNATAYARFGVPNRDGTVQFAVHLLAEFQATKALPAIEDSLSLSIDQIWDHLYADGFFEAMPGILHRLMGDDPEIYDQKLRDPSAPVALQCCLSRSIGYLVAKGIVSEETYCDWLRDYLEIAIREKKSELVTDLVCDILFAANPEDIPLVRSAFENELVDEDRMPREEAEEWFQERSTSIAEILPDPKRDFADAAKELSGWSWFQDVSKRLSELKTASPVTIDVSESPSDGILHLPPSGRYPIPLPMSNDDEPEPLKALQKIGRNDPCPCGSGKKYKKCCMK